MSPKMSIRLTNYVLILFMFCLSHIQCFDGTGVPVLMWRTQSQTSNPLNSISKSTITRIDPKVLSEDYLNDSQTIIAFIQNDLSIEQFSTEDKNRFKTLNHIITDQTLESTILTDVLDPNESLKDFSVQEIKDLNINNGNKIVINLPKNSLIENDELIGQLLTKIRQNVSTDALFLVTGRHNSQYKQEVESDDQIVVNHRFRRHILADDSKKRRKNSLKNSDDMKRLVKVDDCLFFFMRTLSVRSANSTILITSFDSLRNKPEMGESKCWKNNGDDPAVLELTYHKTTNKLRLVLTIGRNKRGDFWEIKTGYATLTDSSSEPTTYKLNVEDINAENQFSYSCSQLTIASKADKPNASGLSQIRLVFENFQLQPFQNQRNKKGDKKLSENVFYIFADSSDCQQWMTLGLWMGLITLILFITILLIGVYALWKVNTPDRFENPKGKPLIITNTDE